MSGQAFDLIEDQLFLGSESAVTFLDFKYIVTVAKDRVQKPHIKENLFIEVEDNQNEDLISFFDTSSLFISKVLATEQPVLVHCVAGVSRSATIVIAYLMKKHGYSKDEAFKIVKSKRPIIEPNQGFAHQLEIYEEMNNSIDKTHPKYRSIVLKSLKYKVSSSLLNQAPFYLKAEPILKEFSTYFEKLKLSSPYSSKYTFKCKKCRLFLFEDISLFGTLNNFFNCSSVFIEPLSWMTCIISKQMRGMLSCPRCFTKLGYFDWEGLRCDDTCLKHVKMIPSFKLNLSKLDSHLF